MQPESLFLRETLRLVVPEQSPLDLSEQTRRGGGEMTGVFTKRSVQETGDKSICMVIRRAERWDFFLIRRNKED